MFIPQETIAKDDGSEDLGGLSTCTVEQLTTLPEWLVPLSRRNELDRYKAGRASEARANLQAQWMARSLEHENNTKPGDYPNSTPKVEYGPRGGRYTDEITRDGRPYRRYF